MPANQHVHKFSGETSYDYGHDHHYSGVTSMSTERGLNHIHIIRVRTTVNDAHDHGIYVQTGPGGGSREDMCIILVEVPA